jgi:hypothetical protein
VQAAQDRARLAAEGDRLGARALAAAAAAGKQLRRVDTGPHTDQIAA